MSEKRTIDERTKVLFQQAMLESFANKLVIHVNRGIDQFLKKVLDALNSINNKAKEFALDHLIKNEYEKADYIIRQEAVNIKSKIYSDINMVLAQQKELASVVNFFTDLLSSAISTMEKQSLSISQQIKEGAPVTDELQLFIEQLSEQLKDIERRNKTLQEENQRLQNYIRALQQSKELTESEIASLRQQIEERDKKIKELLSALLTYKEQFEKLQAQKREVFYDERISEYEAKLNKLKVEYAFEHEQRVKLEQQLKELRNELESVKSENKAWKERYTTLEEKTKKVNAELLKIRDFLLALQKEKQELEQEASRNIQKAAEYDKLIVQLGILDELMMNNPQYAALRILSNKIAEGVFKISAEELGYRHGDISLAAWFENLFGYLKKKGLVDFEIEAGRGFPKGWLVVTEKGKSLFFEVRKRIFSR